MPAHHTAQGLSKFSRRQRNRDQKYIKKPHGYSLARAHHTKISKLVAGRSATTLVASQLRTLTQSVEAGGQREYLEEAIGCFEAKFERAAIVLVWCLCYDKFRRWIFNKNLAVFNAITKSWKKPVSLTAIEDFDDLAERIVIDVARTAKILSKEQHKILVSLLDRRNSYAHPTGRPMAPSIAEAYIHEAIEAVIAKY